MQGRQTISGQRPLRFGLAGTGYWARITHAPALASVPREQDEPLAPLRTALTELADNARSGQLAHACDVRFGRDVGRVLADAQRQLGARRG